MSNKKLVKCELKGYLLTTDSNKFVTESEYNINRFSKLLTNSGIEDFDIEMQGNKFCITTKKKINIDTKIENEEEIKSIVRGSFMGAGSVNDPKNKYHLEIVFQSEENAKKIKELIDKVRINCKILKREKSYIIYMKDGEDIANFLAFIGANKAVLNFEDIRVLRDIRNNVNRIVNCETANLSKTIDAALKQINAINKLKENGIFNKLPENLQEIANLRIENPEASLVELGNMLNEPIGKSGVNYRLKTIIKIAEES